jgi:hypothetical protein
LGLLFVFALFSIGLFVALTVVKVESLIAKGVLSAIAVAAWIAFGLIGVMVATAMMSIGILIADKMPTISKL